MPDGSPVTRVERAPDAPARIPTRGGEVEQGTMGDGQGLHMNVEGRRHSEPNFKRRRITKACDFCHRRGRKCKPAIEQSGVTPVIGPDGQPACLTCIEHGAECTWNRVAAKRGVKSKTSPGSVRQSQSRDGSERWVYDESRHGSSNLVHRLICIFFDTVYPVFVSRFNCSPSLCCQRSS